MHELFNMGENTSCPTNTFIIFKQNERCSSGDQILKIFSARFILVYYMSAYNKQPSVMHVLATNIFSVTYSMGEVKMSSKGTVFEALCHLEVVKLENQRSYDLMVKSFIP